MPKESEYLFAEIPWDREMLENFADELSAYYQTETEKARRDFYRKFLSRLDWHIKHTLSGRQKDVISLILVGKTQREIGAILGITQQVVHIYKKRAINKLQQKFRSSAVCQKAKNGKTH